MNKDINTLIEMRKILIINYNDDNEKGHGR